MIPPSLVRCPHSPPPACHRSHTQDVPSYANSYTLAQEDNNNINSDDATPPPAQSHICYNTGTPAISGLNTLNLGPQVQPEQGERWARIWWWHRGHGLGARAQGRGHCMVLAHVQLFNGASALACLFCSTHSHVHRACCCLTTCRCPSTASAHMSCSSSTTCRTGSYVRLPHTVLSVPKPISPSGAHCPPMAHPVPAQAMVHAYHSMEV